MERYATSQSLMTLHVEKSKARHARSDARNTQCCRLFQTSQLLARRTAIVTLMDKWNVLIFLNLASHASQDLNCSQAIVTAASACLFNPSAHCVSNMTVWKLRMRTAISAHLPARKSTRPHVKAPVQAEMNLHSSSPMATWYTRRNASAALV